MNHLKSSLSKVSAAAVALGLVACGAGNQQSQAQAPRNLAEQQPSTSEQYGAAMGQQPGATGNEMGQPTQSPSSMGGAQGAQPGQQPGMTPEPGATSGQYGGTYGQGATSGQTPGAEYGGTGTQAGGAPGPQMGGSQMGEMGQGGPMGPAGGSMDVSTLNDAQLAAVVQAINHGELQDAQLAETKARSPEVKRFAREMATAHHQEENKQSALFSRLQITPSDNTVSQALKSESQTHLSNLQGLRGNDFDQAYMADQVRAHNNALELLDRAIPNAKNAELKGELQNVRAKIASHLADAERIQQTLPKGATNNPEQNQRH